MNQNFEQFNQFIQTLSIDELRKVEKSIDDRIRLLEKDREEKAKKQTDDEFFEQLFQSTLNLLTNQPTINLEKAMEKAYQELPFDVRWNEVTIDLPEYGCTPRCSDDDCWYHGNMDRLGEYDGTSFELVIDRSINFCEICVQNADMCDEESEAIDDWLNWEVIDKFDQWNIKRLQSQKDCPRFIKLFQDEEECHMCQFSESEGTQNEEPVFYFDTQSKKIICNECLLKV